MPSASMTEVRRVFTERLMEVETYLKFVHELDAGHVRLSFQSNSVLNQNDTGSWIKTLKASCFLIIYNLVESTMKNGIEAIFDDLKIHGVSYDACRDEVRRIIILNFKALSPDRALSDLSQIAQDVVIKTFDKARLFSGNIDSRKIKATARSYGFREPSGKGHQLLSIKNNRNDLAHGDKSFDEIGRNYSMDEILIINNDTKAYLESALDSIDQYIDNKHYLLVPPSSLIASSIPAT